jgi:hypothetical protein
LLSYFNIFKANKAFFKYVFIKHPPLDICTSTELFKWLIHNLKRIPPTIEKNQNRITKLPENIQHLSTVDEIPMRIFENKNSNYVFHSRLPFLVVNDYPSLLGENVNEIRDRINGFDQIYNTIFGVSFFQAPAKDTSSPYIMLLRALNRLNLFKNCKEKLNLSGNVYKSDDEINLILSKFNDGQGEYDPTTVLDISPLKLDFSKCEVCNVLLNTKTVNEIISKISDPISKLMYRVSVCWFIKQYFGEKHNSIDAKNKTLNYLPYFAVLNLFRQDIMKDYFDDRIINSVIPVDSDRDKIIQVSPKEIQFMNEFIFYFVDSVNHNNPVQLIEDLSKYLNTVSQKNPEIIDANIVVKRDRKIPDVKIDEIYSFIDLEKIKEELGNFILFGIWLLKKVMQKIFIQYKLNLDRKPFPFDFSIIILTLKEVVMQYKRFLTTYDIDEQSSIRSNIINTFNTLMAEIRDKTAKGNDIFHECKMLIPMFSLMINFHLPLERINSTLINNYFQIITCLNQFKSSFNRHIIVNKRKKHANELKEYDDIIEFFGNLRTNFSRIIGILISSWNSL